MTNLEKLYGDVATELGLSVAEVEQVHRYQFLFTAEQMALPEKKAVRWPIIGAMQIIQFRLDKAKDAEIKKNFHAFGFHAA